ncbi:MAG: PAC2 family protein [Candidatus Woesearchaeota archaeon]|nr:PAC2 family protein [Candidatus Woesearchaeota archaeon]
MKWDIRQSSKKLPKLNKPILVEGLPGIGNVGKIAVDFIVEELKPDKVYEIFSDSFPHSVFVNEKNLVELPSVRIYAKKMKDGRDLLFLAGDVQPVDEASSYEFAEKILDIFDKMGGSEIITLGGIGLSEAPESPKVFCTGNSKELIEKYKKGTEIECKLYGIVGPIIGAAGLLLGLSNKNKAPGIALLAETFGHPMYIGIKGAKEIVNILNKKLNLKIKTEKLDKDIKELDGQMAKPLPSMKKMPSKDELKSLQKHFRSDTSYIG